MRKGRILFIAVAGMVALFAIARFTRTAEPTYHGHSLSKWVAILGEGSHQEATVQQAVEAVNSIGTNATPYLLAWIQFEPKPGPFQSRANIYNDNWQQLSLRDRVLYDYFRSRRQRAAEGAGAAFQVLGARAAPAIPELVRLMNGRAGSITAIRAALALGLLGTNGLPALLAAIDDPEHQNRFEALSAISMLPDDLTPSAERVVPHLIPCVSDQKDRRVAPAAVYALRKFRSAPQLVLPVLTNCLSSTNNRIRYLSVTALGSLGRPAAAALPALTNALRDPDPSVGEAARYAIGNIASEAPSNAPAP